MKIFKLENVKLVIHHVKLVMLVLVLLLENVPNVVLILTAITDNIVVHHYLDVSLLKLYVMVTLSTRPDLKIVILVSTNISYLDLSVLIIVLKDIGKILMLMNVNFVIIIVNVVLVHIIMNVVVVMTVIIYIKELVYTLAQPDIILITKLNIVNYVMVTV